MRYDGGAAKGSPKHQGSRVDYHGSINHNDVTFTCLHVSGVMPVPNLCSAAIREHHVAAMQCETYRIWMFKLILQRPRHIARNSDTHRDVNCGARRYAKDTA